MKGLVGMWTAPEMMETTWMDRVLSWMVNAIVWTFVIGGVIVASGMILTM